jgi:hypothetical protein
MNGDRVPTSKSTGITYDSEEAFFERYFSVDKKEETHSSLGDALSQAMKFEQIKSKLRKLVNTGETDNLICKELNITPSELSQFKLKLKKTRDVKSSVSDKIRNREVSLEEFLDDLEGDVDILPWQSYYEVLKFASKELSEVRHVKDRFLGILIGSKDVKPLIRKALHRMYPVEVLKCIREKKLVPVVLKTVKEDTKTFNRKREGKIRMRDIVIRKDVIRICQRQINRGR